MVGIPNKLDTYLILRLRMRISYRIVLPDGEEIITDNLRKFCDENGLDVGNMIKVSQSKRKHHKGYVCFCLTGVQY